MIALAYRVGTADEDVIREVFESQDYAGVLAFPAPPKPLIVDAGAHIGCAARWFLDHFPDARVVALEPDAGNFKYLVDNARGFDIVPVRAGLAGRPQMLRVTDRDRGTWGYRTETAAEAYGSDVTTGITMAWVLADAMAVGYEPFIVKIDIEGAEREVFSGDTSWLAKVPVVVIELHDDHPGLAGCAESFWHAVEGRNNTQQGTIVLSVRA